MFARHTWFLCTIVSVVAMASAGCSDPYGGRMEVSGAVKLKGEPLKDGSILFEPMQGQDTHGGAQVSNGEYKLPRTNGLKPGQYLVRLTAGDGVTPARASARVIKPGDNEPVAAPGGSRNIVSMDLIPDEWNVRSNQKIEVKSNGPNQFDFDIPTVNSPRQKR
jgi:hypothetical protein